MTESASQRLRNYSLETTALAIYYMGRGYHDDEAAQKAIDEYRTVSQQPTPTPRVSP